MMTLFLQEVGWLAQRVCVLLVKASSKIAALIYTPVGCSGGYLGPQTLAKARYKILNFLPNLLGGNWCVVEGSICTVLIHGFGQS